MGISDERTTLGELTESEIQLWNNVLAKYRLFEEGIQELAYPTFRCALKPKSTLIYLDRYKQKVLIRPITFDGVYLSKDAKECIITYESNRVISGSYCNCIENYEGLMSTDNWLTIIPTLCHDLKLIGRVATGSLLHGLRVYKGFSGRLLFKIYNGYTDTNFVDLGSRRILCVLEQDRYDTLYIVDVNNERYIRKNLGSLGQNARITDSGKPTGEIELVSSELSNLNKIITKIDIGKEVRRADKLSFWNYGTWGDKDCRNYR